MIAIVVLSLRFVLSWCKNITTDEDKFLEWMQQWLETYGSFPDIYMFGTPILDELQRDHNRLHFPESQSSSLFNAALWFLQSKGSPSKGIGGHFQEFIGWADSHNLCPRIFTGARQRAIFSTLMQKV
jgi:hypothetical protein